MTRTASEIQLFSVDKANRTLPLVRRIVDDIVVEHPRWRDLVARYELLAAGARPERGESDEMRRLRREIEAAATRISGYIAELELIGCQLKDFERGLVDFHGMYQGRLVALCWRHGEPAVTHWHEMEAGFAGRQDVTPEFAAAVAEAAA